MVMNFFQVMPVADLANRDSSDKRQTDNKNGNCNRLRHIFPLSVD
jgi:hypothetical protein